MLLLDTSVVIIDVRSAVGGIAVIFDSSPGVPFQERYMRSDERAEAWGIEVVLFALMVCNDLCIHCTYLPWFNIVESR